MADEQLAPAAGGGFDLTTPGKTVWTLTDNENTVRDLATYNVTTGVTSVVNHRVFSAYGELLSQTNPQAGTLAAVDCLFAYTGEPMSQFSENSEGGVTGIQNNGERWYDAITGRWLSQDPISFLSGDSNLYCYCGNTPTTFVDPSGMDRYLVFEWGHLYILVDVWNAAGTQVVGYVRLEFNLTGYHVNPVPNPCFPLDSPGEYVTSTYRSNAAQDNALIALWQSQLSLHYWEYWYILGINDCFDQSRAYGKYYGGPAGGPTDAASQGAPPPSPKAPGIKCPQ